MLGWRTGPVRAIREVWGADSGTNVTKTETYYRDAITYRYRVRVHPIPPDGLYTSWDYNRGVAGRHYNMAKPEGVGIDGANDDVRNVDKLPTGDPRSSTLLTRRSTPRPPSGTGSRCQARATRARSSTRSN